MRLAMLPNARHCAMLAQELASQEQAPAGEPRKMTSAVSIDWFERPSTTARHQRPDLEAEHAAPRQWAYQHWPIKASMNDRADTVSTGRGGARLTGPGLGHGVVAEHSSGVGPVTPDWPLVSKLELGPLATAIGCGRDHARQVLIEWGLGHLVDDAALLVSELLTNALKASQSLGVPTPIVLRLLANDRQLIIEAWDSWVEGFNLQRRSSEGENGRGLQVVAALSRRWGVGRISDHYKVVWCELRVEASQGGKGTVGLANLGSVHEADRRNC